MLSKFAVAFNWTIWNWNEETAPLYIFVSTLLIEPFGIETFIQGFHRFGVFKLLIEPFGIETEITNSKGETLTILLIEPFGIETSPKEPAAELRKDF